MAKARQIQKRLRAVRNIRTITRTMEMTAVGRFKRLHDRALPAAGALARLEQVLSDAVAQAAPLTHPLLEQGQGDAVALVVLTSNRGLCGGYNNRVLEAAGAAVAELARRGLRPRPYLVGKKGLVQLRHRTLPPPFKTVRQFEGAETAAQVSELAEELIGLFRSGEAAAVQVVYQRMFSAAVFRPETVTLLPLAVEPAATMRPALEFMPSAAGVLQRLLPMAVRVRLLHYFYDALVSEQVSRMMAMRAATTNAEDMIRTLTRRINRLRQSQITTELAEIMTGAEALR
jgi:F-type H+-transporting ATPase subunit gamma